MLNRNGESRSIYVAPDLRWKSFQSFTFKYDLSSGLFVDALYQVEESPSTLSLLSVFIVTECWILSNVFSHLLRWSCGFILYSITVVYYTDWFLYVQWNLYSWGKFHLFIVFDSFEYVTRFSLLVVYWGFYTYIYKGYCSVIFFSCYVIVHL